MLTTCVLSSRLSSSNWRFSPLGLLYSTNRCACITANASRGNGVKRTAECCPFSFGQVFQLTC